MEYPPTRRQNDRASAGANRLMGQRIRVTDIAIRVEHLSKLYHIGKLQHRHDTLREALAGSFKRADAQGTDDLLWALRDISFDVRRGEVIGIIGRNGAGKSTLLKILSRITEPTEGRAEIHGRVGSLLEVGTGFHPELTGRENIFLNGAILGMHRAEITRKFDEIVAFAEIEKFLDTPVKRYSSGMYVRLAFAVAAHLEPEILLVDEVLAVGDAAFQKKCLGKMGDVAKEGRTVLFVSHNMASIEVLCRRAVVLQHGAISYLGPADQAVESYMAALEQQKPVALVDRRDCVRPLGRCSDHKKVLAQDAAGAVRDQLQCGRPCAFVLEYQSERRLQASEIMFAVSINTKGVHLFTMSTEYSPVSDGGPPASGAMVCRLPVPPLSPGVYQINVICRVGGAIEDWVKDAMVLSVVEADYFGTGRLPPDSHPGLLVSQEWSRGPSHAA